MFCRSTWFPFLKYPANPPAVSLDETIRQRTLLYLLMVVLSAALFGGRGRDLGRDGWSERFGRVERDIDRRGAHTSWPIAVVMLILPTIDETPGPLLDDAGKIIYDGFPADDLYQFRLYSLGTQLDPVGDHRAGVRALVRGCSVEAAGAATA